MRCLYCGKELALFKRLRGSEFCSDAHRQRYQEEYTQLALNRLLQTNSASEREPEAAPKSGAGPERPSRSSTASKSVVKDLESPALRRREMRQETPAPAKNGLAAVPPPVAVEEIP